MNTLSSIMKIPGVKSAISYFYKSEQTICPVTVMGLSFVNPVGIAAGFDKDGKYFKPLSALGFGFIEIGTVTPLPQSGNTKPRLFRLKKDAAIINRMGFNNDGVDALVNRLKERKNSKIIIGGNIGKNKITPNDKAEQDYLICLEKLYPYVDYFVVNVSSPNTEGLRELQDKKPLLNLLTQLQNKAKQYNKLKPILLKIAPDLNNDQLDDIAQIINETDIEGVIATNTTVAREDLKTDKAIIQEIGNGGLSGKPLKERSTEVIRYLRKRLQENKTIIGVGGIHSEVDAQEKIEAGANLVQLYTGFIYEGPALIQRISKKIKHA